MKIPRMLNDYLEETEQNADDMSFTELFEEAQWVLSEYHYGDYYPSMYSAKDAAALKRFITVISGKMMKNKVAHQ